MFDVFNFTAQQQDLIAQIAVFCAGIIYWSATIYWFKHTAWTEGEDGVALRLLGAMLLGLLTLLAFVLIVAVMILSFLALVALWQFGLKPFVH